MDTITRIIPGLEDEMTEVYLIDDDDALEVEESMEEILKKVTEAT